jgi:hypothetical protein
MNNATTIKLRPAATSALERASAHGTCECCGREEVKLVKMTDGNAVVWIGRGCAAKSMGVGLTEFGREAREVQKAADKAEVAAKIAAHERRIYAAHIARLGARATAEQAAWLAAYRAA